MNWPVQLLWSFALAVSAGAVTDFVAPEYPGLARKARMRGRVEVVVQTDPAGRVVSARSLGQVIPFGVTESAVEAAKRWRFNTGQFDNAEFTLVFDYRLSGSCEDHPAFERVGPTALIVWAAPYKIAGLKCP